MTDHVEELRTAGFTVVPGAFPAAQIDALADRMDALLADDEATWGKDRLLKIHQWGALRNLADRGPEFERLLDTDQLHRTAAELLGKSYRLHSFDGLILQPGEGRFPWDFHTDLLALAGTAFPADSPPGLNSLVAVDESGPENGATWLIPGSHRSVVRDPDPEVLAGLAIQPRLRRGDLLLFDARIWHCAGENRSAAVRRLIKIEMVRPWLRTQMDYARSVRPEVLERLSPRARAAIGEPLTAGVQEFWQAAERAT